MTCTCGATFTTRSTAKNGNIHADVCSQCHPFYTGKQKILDTGGRVARFEKRYAAKADKEVAPHRHRPGGPTAVRPGRCRRTCVHDGRSTDRRTMFEQVQRLVDEHAALGAQLSDPAVHADPANARRLGRRYAELGAVVATYQDWLRAEGDLVAARELTAEDPAFAAEADAAGRATRRAGRTAAPSAGAP